MGKIEPVIDEYRQQLESLREEARNLAAELADKEREVTVLEARISGLEEARELLATKSRNKTTDRKPRTLSAEWKDILSHLALNGPIEFGYSELAAAAGGDVKQENLRSQMSLYKGRGWVEPKGEGRFRLTKEGFDLLGLEYPYGDYDTIDDFEDLTRPTPSRRPVPAFDDDLDSEVPF